MFDDMGGEYDRFRLENHLKRPHILELVALKKVKIQSKLTEKNHTRLNHLAITKLA